MTILILNWIALILTLVGAINWGLIGIFNWNLVEAIFGVGYNAGTATIYILVLIASLWIITSLILCKGKFSLVMSQPRKLWDENRRREK